MTPERIGVFIGIPYYARVEGDTLAAIEAIRRIPGLAVRLQMSSASCLPVNRNSLIASWLDAGPDWPIFFGLDADVVIGPVEFARYLSEFRGGRWDILWGAYPLKAGPPGGPWVTAGHFRAGYPGDTERHEPASSRGVVPVDWGGGGLFLARREAADRMGRAWFASPRFRRADGSDAVMPEDVGMAVHAAASGAKMGLWCDTGARHLTRADEHGGTAPGSVRLALGREQVRTVLRGLSALPFSVAAPILRDISAQIKPQIK